MKHTCKFCSQRFLSGRALGGHMRSHLVFLKKQGRRIDPSLSPPEDLASDEKHLGESDDVMEAYVLRHSSEKGFKLPGFAAGSSSVIRDRESDAESQCARPKQRSRSKRKRRAMNLQTSAVAELDSSVSDFTPDEDVAILLMMLSQDSWARDSIAARSVSEDSFDVGDEIDKCDGEKKASLQIPRGRYSCNTCRKLFFTFRSLVAHRASHNRGTSACSPAFVPGATHECPFCFRVFSSGQALGGHKRSHTSAAGAPTQRHRERNSKFGNSFGVIDLNVPAELEEDFELSAVYDAEIGSSHGIIH